MAENNSTNNNGAKTQKAPSTPKTQEAMRRNGINQEDLKPKTRQEILVLVQSRDLTKYVKDEQVIKHFTEHMENRRKKQLDLVEKTRAEIVEQEQKGLWPPNFLQKSMMMKKTNPSNGSKSLSIFSIEDRQKKSYEDLQKRQDHEKQVELGQLQVKKEEEEKLEQLRAKIQKKQAMSQEQLLQYDRDQLAKYLKQQENFRLKKEGCQQNQKERIELQIKKVMAKIEQKELNFKQQKEKSNVEVEKKKQQVQDHLQKIDLNLKKLDEQEEKKKNEIVENLKIQDTKQGLQDKLLLEQQMAIEQRLEEANLKNKLNLQKESQNLEMKQLSLSKQLLNNQQKVQKAREKQQKEIAMKQLNMLLQDLDTEENVKKAQIALQIQQDQLLEQLKLTQQKSRLIAKQKESILNASQNYKREQQLKGNNIPQAPSTNTNDTNRSKAPDTQEDSKKT